MSEPLETLDKALEAAAGYFWDSTEITKWIYNTECASLEAINRAFRVATRVSVMRMLYESGLIAGDAILAVFKSAVDGEKRNWIWRRIDRVDIVELLYKEKKCIPPEVIRQALAVCAKRKKYRMVECLQKRLDSDEV
ncbi:unnamed protein product [Phytophthora lilii]|uniref:Unnamed protein product n=1 Tax=Phytophthora lilii TaxID=2077276 RepID=A0A9W6XAN2_9STRA|nr:unnamed protein product [Phytophthora lilii]